MEFCKRRAKANNCDRSSQYFLKEIKYKKKIKFYKEKFYEEKNYVLSSKKSEKYLGWKPIYSNKDIIINTASWYNDYLSNSKNSQTLLKKYLDKYLEMF